MNLPYLRWARSAASVVSAAVLLAACGGGGGGGSPPPATVTISGRITFDRIPFNTTFGNGLDPAATVESPAREVTVQAIDAGNNACSPRPRPTTTATTPCRCRPTAICSSVRAPKWSRPAPRRPGIFRSATTRTPTRCTHWTATRRAAALQQHAQSASTDWLRRHELYRRARSCAVRDPRHRISGEATRADCDADHRVPRR